MMSCCGGGTVPGGLTDGPGGSLPRWRGVALLYTRMLSVRGAKSTRFRALRWGRYMGWGVVIGYLVKKVGSMGGRMGASPDDDHVRRRLGQHRADAALGFDVRHDDRALGQLL